MISTAPETRAWPPVSGEYVSWTTVTRLPASPAGGRAQAVQVLFDQRLVAPRRRGEVAEGDTGREAVSVPLRRAVPGRRQRRVQGGAARVGGAPLLLWGG